jgi:predicted alpha/beta-hydrolase family hydrolase
MGLPMSESKSHPKRPATRSLQFLATEKTGKVSAILVRPTNARYLLILGHGAGAGMQHPFMEAAATQLAEHGIATFRYQFPYMEQGRKPPNPRPVLIETIRSAVTAATQAADDLPLLAGGKSMGGRMTSLAAAEEPLPGVHGLVFFGFPLHASGKPSAERGEHLTQVTIPMLFLQGTRDTLADLSLLQPLTSQLGKRATLHIVDGGDHSFHVLKRSGRTDELVLEELADTVQNWTEQLG